MKHSTILDSNVMLSRAKHLIRSVGDSSPALRMTNLALAVIGDGTFAEAKENASLPPNGVDSSLLYPRERYPLNEVALGEEEDDQDREHDER